MNQMLELSDKDLKAAGIKTQMVNTEIRLIIFFSAKEGEALCSQLYRQGADCGSDHELHMAKFKLKVKTVRESH